MTQVAIMATVWVDSHSWSAVMDTTVGAGIGKKERWLGSCVCERVVGLSRA